MTTSTPINLNVGDYVRLNQTVSVPSIDALYQVASVIDAYNFTIIVPETITIPATAMISGYATPGKIFLTDSVPTNITQGTLTDFIAGANGNSNKDYDELVLSVNSGNNELQYDPQYLPMTQAQAAIFGNLYVGEDSGQFNQVISSIINYVPLFPGDFVSSAQETNVVQIPTDMQPMLAQTIVCRLLEAMGDTQGLQNAQQKLQTMQGSMQSMLGNRILGAPKKINSRRTLIRYSRITFRRGAR